MSGDEPSIKPISRLVPSSAQLVPSPDIVRRGQ